MGRRYHYASIALTMDQASGACRHTDTRTFDSCRCCMSCGEMLTTAVSSAESEATCSGTPFYEYTPLDYNTGQHIRLMKLYPGQTQDDIRCELVNVNLAASPIYEAVSYTWATTNGDASLSQSIICCGKTLNITKNCEAAIQCLRRRKHSRILWIDAM